MADPKKILMLGDTHGNNEHVEWAASVAEKAKADAIFVLGDFGYWEHGDDGAFLDKCSAISSDYGMPIYWLDGNHENHTWLRERYINNAEVPRDEDGFVIMRRGLMHAPRAHTWEWRGYSFMALGGAYSIDKEGRLRGEAKKQRQARAEMRGRAERGARIPDSVKRIAQGESIFWWPEEEITDEEVEEALRVDKVDILLTHDKPLFAEPDWNRKNDPTSMANQEKVQKVMERLRPSILIHGHLHYSYRDEMILGEHEGALEFCEIYGLDCDPWPHSGDGVWWYKKEHSIAMLTLEKDHFDFDHSPSRGSAEEDWNPRGRAL